MDSNSMKMDKEYIWAFMYNPMIEESNWDTMSLHKTKRGAEIAMELHKSEAKKKYDEQAKILGGTWPIEFGAFEGWGVFEMEIFE